MAFVVKRRERFELRESVVTDDGPRARTLATFRVLDDGVLRHARARATQPFDDGEVRARARAAGAPVAAADVVLATRSLLVELDGGRVPPPALARALLSRLPATKAPTEGIGDGLDDALPWVGVDDAARGSALRDLLELADRLPAPKRTAQRKRFPRLVSRAR